MKCILLANGDYGQDLTPYQKLISPDDLVICADGGANYAKRMDLTPFCIIGDMDSITADVKEYFHNLRVPIRKYPRQKDFTDTQLALSVAEEQQVKEIILFGSLGLRLDHSLSNLYGCMEAVRRGTRLMHYTPEMALHLVNDSLELHGQKGDLVSVLTLTDEAVGVCEIGFEYPLEKVILSKENPYAISNRMLSERATISVEHGILAVFHYF